MIENNMVRYDPNIVEYETLVKAYLEKRWTTKDELPAKIYILEQIPEIAESLSQQKLVFMKRLYGMEMLEKMHSAEEINSQYIISITGEEYFKPLIDEYLGKVLINGQTPPLEKLQEYEAIKEKCRKIFLRFFYGDSLTEYEKDIEFRYLISKQQKYLRWVASKRKELSCMWTVSNQKCLEQQKNWIARDLNQYDDFRPIYEPLDLLRKVTSTNESLSLNQEGWRAKLLFKLFEERSYQNLNTRTSEIVQTLLHRTEAYIKSIEFTRYLGVPPDFHIEHAILNMHIWLMVNRLNQINTKESKLMAKNLELEFKNLTLDKVNKIHLRKKNDFIKDVSHFMKNNRAAYDQHFITHPKTSTNPYYKLDALVWSTVLFEKIERYSDLVYLISEYFIKHYDYLETVSYEKFEGANILWDIYRIPVNFKAKLIEVNPPLSPEELEAEIKSDAKVKKHYYTYDNPEFELPINKEVDNVINRRFEQVHMKIFATMRKFNTIQTYDYYSEREEKDQEKIKQAKKYVWQTEKDKFHSVDAIKRARNQMKSGGNPKK